MLSGTMRAARPRSDVKRLQFMILVPFVSEMGFLVFMAEKTRTTSRDVETEFDPLGVKTEARSECSSQNRRIPSRPPLAAYPADRDCIQGRMTTGHFG
jgi:hypothetical protein